MNEVVEHKCTSKYMFIGHAKEISAHDLYVILGSVYNLRSDTVSLTTFLFLNREFSSGKMWSCVEECGADNSVVFHYQASDHLQYLARTNLIVDVTYQQSVGLRIY
ncbi:hypothetical protein Ddye_003714 [Dipteronia dyeriana]|uniref:Uncharacterized protein n=1 Tax=Dipteronia dyeriana TaxID=168575 RepID=A0AAE0CVL2_9ROSI|nr:hypothetical protein Ddye_003714 [Dipteronia dyeriana]